jgi:hypothetical protein
MAEKTETAVQKFDTKVGDQFLAAARKAAESIVIRNDTDFEAVWARVVKCDQFLKGEFIGKAVAQKSRLYEAYKYQNDLVNSFVNPVKEIKDRFLAARVRYQQEKQRKADQKRIEDERIARERQIEDAKRVAADLKKEGAKEEAKAVIEHAKTAPVVMAPAKPVVAKAEGSVMTTVYDYVIENPVLVPLPYRPIDERLIRRQVNSFGVDANIPGVKVTSRQVESTRGVA